MSSRTAEWTMRFVAALLAGFSLAARAGGPSNLVANGNFSGGKNASGWPTGWEYYTTSRGGPELAGLPGQLSVRLAAQGQPHAFQGIFQRIPVTEGERYTVNVRVLNAKDDPLGMAVVGRLVIEWINASDREVGRETANAVDGTFSRLRWEDRSLRRIRAPKGAVAAKIGFHLFDGERGGQGSVLIDDFTVTSP